MGWCRVKAKEQIGGWVFLITDLEPLDTGRVAAGLPLKAK